MGFMSFELSQFAKSNDLFVAIFRYISFFSVKPMKEFEIFFLGKFSKKNHRQIKKKFFFSGSVFQQFQYLGRLTVLHDSFIDQYRVFVAKVKCYFQ